LTYDRYVGSFTIFLGVMCIGIILRKYCNRRGYTTGSGSLTILNNIISTPWRPGVEVEDASVLKGTHIPVISQCARFELITLPLFKKDQANTQF
jgi:hypothetical protein